MPPRKRKPIAVDSDIGDDFPTPAKGKASPCKSTTTTTAKPSKKRASTSNAVEVEISDYVAKLTTSEYTVIQTFVCQSFKPSMEKASLTEKCISCIEKQSIAGACRFVNMRAFRKDSCGKVDYADYAFRSHLDMSGKVMAKKAPEAHPRSGPATSKPGKKATSTLAIPATRRSTRSRTVAEEPPPVVVLGIGNDTDKAGQSAAGVLAAEHISVNNSSAITSTLETEANNTSAIKHTLTPVELRAQGDYILHLIALTFAGQLRREGRHELTHLGLPTKDTALPGGARPLIRILSIPETRSLCDNCATSIYIGSYLCGCCGRELCLGCWEEWEPSATRGTRARLRRVDTCSRRRRHIRDSMVFVSRATEGKVAKLLERVEARIPSAEKEAQEISDASVEIESIPTFQPKWPNEELRYLATPKTHHNSITLRQFQSLLRCGGIPLVLTGFLDRFRLPWNPQYFIQHHGSESCFVHDCNDGAIMETTVKSFFTNFVNADTIDSYKLKDWPPSADFSATFPKLFSDFENSLPFPSYTSRKGTLNLATHFPKGYNAPDLGPKMYNAYPAPDFLPSLFKNEECKPRAVKGTTNLHLDLTDAMNIMLFSAGGTRAPDSATVPKGIPLCGAIWDIFPPSASAHLRAYLNSETYLATHAHEGAEKQDDPIHRQLYYLTEADLITLYKGHGVMSYRIYQEPGEAVFIPAGCAHQVRNRRSCVKVAVDFLTPENAAVCKGLVEEGRWMGDPFKGRPGQGKEDVLQLWACLGFAWEVFDEQPEMDGVGLKGRMTEVRGSRVEKESERDTPMSDIGKTTCGEQKSDIIGNGHSEQPTRTEIGARPLDGENIDEIKDESEPVSRGGITVSIDGKDFEV